MSERPSWLSRGDRVVSQGILHRLAQGMAWLGGGCALVLMVIATVSVFGRRIPLFAGPWLAFTLEYAEFLMAMVIAFTVTYTWYERGHVRIGIIFDSLSPKAKEVIDLLATVVGCGIYGYVGLSMWQVAMAWLESGRRTSIMAIVEWPFVLIFCAAFSIFCLVMVRSLIGFVIRVSGRHIERGGLY